MNKKLVILLVFSLISCNYRNSSNEEIVLTTSFDVFSYYQEKIDYLNNIYDLKKQVINKDNNKIENLTFNYWKEYSSLISVLQEKFLNEEIKSYFIQQLGEEKVNDIVSIDVNDIFYNRKYYPFNINEIEILFNDINFNIEQLSPYSAFKDNLVQYVTKINEYISSLRLINVLSDLYLDNSYYFNETVRLETSYPTLSNNYKNLFKILLTNKNYKDNVIKEFGLTKDEVNYFLSSENYTPVVLNLFKQEAELENEYIALNTNLEKENLYLELINVRNRISKELGYGSYLEYVYQSVYSRNYTIYDGMNLINNIYENKEMKNNYLLFASSKENPSYYFVSEKDLLENLDFITEIVPNAKDIIKEFKMYGFYNFDYRNNKYQGSYKTSLDYLDEDQFILLNVNGNITDYNSLFHEFGHYLASKLENKNLVGNKFDLDIAEVHSQSLEYLMSHYYSLFLDKHERECLIENLIFNALWTIYSSSLISEFEYYVYTTRNIDLDFLRDTFNELVIKHIYPYSFGLENNNYLFTNISHIFTSPGYYISYLTSIIPSLELWSNSNLDLVKKQYKTILEYGTSNDFIYVLNQVNLSSPFEKDAIDKISNKIENMKKS